MQNRLTFSLVTGIAFCVLPLTVYAQRPGSTQPQTPPTLPEQPGVNDPTRQPSSNETMRNTMDDKAFLKKAAMGGLVEVELGKLAAEKGSSDSVKQFGQKMVDDHTKANDQLKQVANSESIEIPNSLSSKEQSRVDKLSKLSGAAFDRAYINDQLKDHQHDVQEFQMEAQNGSNAAVKSFASATLPTLQEHLKMVKDLHKSAKSTSMR